MNETTTYMELNKYPPDQYNVLVPVTIMQVTSNLQKIVVKQVQLSDDESGPDVYKEKSSGKLAITKVGALKLAAAANISIVESRSVQPEVCQRCVEMAKATGKAQPCGNCAHMYDVKYSVTVRVPEPSGGFRMITMTKEIDCTIEKAGMTDAQYKRFLPHRASMAESKATMRAFRAALQLNQTYTHAEIKKPFIIAHIVPNLDAPDIRQALINNSLKDMGLLFETPTKQEAITQAEPPALPGSTDGFSEADYPDNDEPFTESEYAQETQEELPPWEEQPQRQAIVCADCGKQITEAKGKNGQTWTPENVEGYSVKRFGRCLCLDCQVKQANNRR